MLFFFSSVFGAPGMSQENDETTTDSIILTSEISVGKKLNTTKGESISEYQKYLRYEETLSP